MAGRRAPNPGGAACLLEQYEKQGIDFLACLNGWFGGFLVDLGRNTAFVFNDRYGLGRVYYHEDSEAFLFSTEAKSLLAVLPGARRLDERGTGEWLSCGCVLQNRTLFPGISLLPPASAWMFSGDRKLSRRRYFDPGCWETQPRLSPEAYYQQLKAIFPKVAHRYATGERKVAMSLTGGLDGRMMMSWIRRGPGELPCYTFNGSVRDCADVRIARRVALACGQPHHTIPVGKEFLSEFPVLAEESVRCADGAMDVTGAVELYVNRLAGRIAPVRLTGNYGSEILRSNVAFRPRELRSKPFAPELLGQAEKAAQTYADELDACRLSFIAFKQVPWHHFARFAIEQSQLEVRSPYLDNELVALAFQAPAQAAAVEPYLRLIAEGNPQLGRIPTDRGLTCPAGGLANRLRRCFEEFMAKAEYACDYGMPNWLARVERCLSPFRADHLFLGRQKFCHFRTWYRRELAAYVKQVLLDPKSLARAHVNRRRMEHMVHAHLRGSANHTLEIHKSLSLELVHRTLLDH